MAYGDALGTAQTESVIRANTLDQMGAPASNLSMNNKQLISVGTATSSTSAPTVGQLAGNQLPYIVSGCVWTADSSGSTLAGSMTSGTVMIKGILLTVAAVTSRTFTASKDTYVDLQDNTDGTASITYTEVGNNAASPNIPGGQNALTSIRCAIIVSSGSALTTGIATINQGSSAITGPGTSAQTSTVAAGSNGANITASTLSVAANSLPAAGQISITHSTQQYVLAYTGGGGTTTLTGVTVVTGSGTVSTGDVITTLANYCVSDSLGNIIFPTSPGNALIGVRNLLVAFTTTATSAVPMGAPSGAMVVPFIVPAGTPRRLKVWLNLPLFGSSATAGTTLTCNLVTGNNTNVVASQQPKVNVTSDQTSMFISGSALLAPGSYTAQVWLTQGAAGTLTAGILFVQTQMGVELT